MVHHFGLGLGPSSFFVSMPQYGGSRSQPVKAADLGSKGGSILIHPRGISQLEGGGRPFKQGTTTLPTHVGKVRERDALCVAVQLPGTKADEVLVDLLVTNVTSP